MEQNNNEKKPLDIPSFVNKGEDEQIDMSVFQMSEEEEFEEPVKRPKPYKKQRIVMIVLIALLAIGIGVGGIYYGVSSYNKAQEAERLRLEEEKKKEAAAAKAEEEAKKQQEEAAKAEAEKQKYLGAYTIKVTVKLRSGAGTGYDVISKDAVPEKYADVVKDSLIPEGSTVEVLEYKEDSSTNMKWGRIGDNAWFCIQNGDDIYASK